MRPHFRFFVLALLAVASGCFLRGKPGEEPAPRPDPIPVQVKNENFLDVNVYVIAGGVSRRLGTVPGNGAAKFKIDWSAAFGQPITISATTIGGPGTAQSSALSVGYGQMIYFTVGSVLRQSSWRVGDP